VNLQQETALSLSLTGQWNWDALSINTTVYYTDFSDFIYQAATGDVLDELPVFVYQQDDAEFYGLDFSAELQLGELAGGELSFNTLFDFVTASVDTREGSSNLPRIPADRVGMGVRWTDQSWTLALNYLHVDAQNRVADFELATDGYQDLSVRIGRVIQMDGYEMQLFLNAKNLSNSEQRHHASFVKDLAPAPGRGFEAGIRVAF
jgi:iron complex outermembrane receptor protein